MHYIYDAAHRSETEKSSKESKQTCDYGIVETLKQTNND